MAKTINETLSIREYLNSYHTRHSIDKVIEYWFSKKDNSNPKKTVKEWERIVNDFYSETDKN